MLPGGRAVAARIAAVQDLLADIEHLRITALGGNTGGRVLAELVSDADPSLVVMSNKLPMRVRAAIQKLRAPILLV